MRKRRNLATFFYFEGVDVCPVRTLLGKLRSGLSGAVKGVSVVFSH